MPMEKEKVREIAMKLFLHELMAGDIYKTIFQPDTTTMTHYNKQSLLFLLSVDF